MVSAEMDGDDDIVADWREGLRRGVESSLAVSGGNNRTTGSGSTVISGTVYRVMLSRGIGIHSAVNVQQEALAVLVDEEQEDALLQAVPFTAVAQLCNVDAEAFIQGC